MAANIAHRGPHGERTWVEADAGIGLAHRHASQKAGAAGSQKPVAAGHEVEAYSLKSLTNIIGVRQRVDQYGAVARHGVAFSKAGFGQ
jgi:hypothetical protein